MPTGARRGWHRAVGTCAAVAVVSTGAWTPAAAVENYPDEPSEAAASILASSLLGTALLGAGETTAGQLSNPGPNDAALDVEVLGGQVVQLGDISLPLAELIDFGQLGLVGSQSEASSPRDARAVSGLVGPDGSVDLSDDPARFGAASIDVLSIADATGASAITDLAIDQLELHLGAFGAEVVAQDGVIQDQNGVGGPGQYVVGQADLLVASPVVEDAAATLYDAAGAVDTAMEQLVNENLDLGLLTALLEVVPGIPEPTLTVDSNMQDTLFQRLTQQPLTSANQLVTLDLSTGELQIHLDKIADAANEGGINDLPANWELIDDTTYPLIAETVHELMQEATNILVGAIEESLDAVSLEIAFYDDSPLGTLDVRWSFSLGQALSGDLPPVVDDSDGVSAVLGGTLATTINGLGDATSPIFSVLYDLIISDAGNQIFELAVNDLKFAVTSSIRALLSPLFDVLTQLVSLQVNHQVTETCTTAEGEVLSGLDLSALSLGLLQAADGARINLGNAAVRVGACLAAGTPVLAVDPGQVEQGGTVTVSGSGYTPESTVTVQLTDTAGEPVGAPVTVTTDADGAFTTPLTVPADTVPGDLTVVGTDEATGTPAEAPLTVVAVAGEPVITVDPAEVAPGECTVVAGSGFGPGEAVTVQLTDAVGEPVGEPVTVTADASGSFSVEVCVPADAAPGDYTVVAEDESGSTAEENLVVVAAAISPELTVDPGQVAQGGTVTVSGSGYTPDSTVTVQLTDAAGEPVGAPVTVTTDADGAFTTPLVVPADTTPGDLTVVGTDDATGTPAEAPLTVVAAAGEPVIALDPSQVAPGEETTVSGSGFAPDSTVTVQLTDAAGEPVGEPVTVTTDASGALTTRVTVPAGTTPGQYTVVAEDEAGGTAQEVLTVVAAAISPELTVDPGQVAQGGTVTVSGSGYTPESTVSVQLTDAAGEPVGTPVTVTTDASGAFTTPLTVPAGAVPGDHTVVGTDLTTGTPAEAPLTVVAADAPVITLDPSQVAPGGETTVSGSGFAPDSTVTVQLTDAEGEPVGDPVTVTTDENGAFATPVTVPTDAAPGDYTVVAEDESGDTAEAGLAVVGAAEPELTVDPGQVAQGGTVTVSGTAYTPESTVTVQLTDADGEQVGEPVVVTTDEDGAFSVPVTLPAAAVPGQLVAVGTDDATGVSDEATLVVVDVEGESISVNPERLQAGGSAVVRGDGFTPRSTVMLRMIDDGLTVFMLDDVPTDAEGDFEAVVTVPAGVDPDELDVIATDEATGDTASDDLVVFAVAADDCTAPTLVAAPSVVEAGEQVIVTGAGFPAGAGVVVQLRDAAGNPVGAPVTVTATGAEEGGCGGFTVVVTVPSDTQPGAHDVVATPSDGGTGARTPVLVQAPTTGSAPELRELVSWFAASSVPAGGTQVFYARGFEPGELVGAVIRSTLLQLPVAVADATGTVSWEFVVPAGFSAGTHTGTATSLDRGDETSATFQVRLAGTGGGAAVVTAAGAGGPTGSGPAFPGYGDGALPRTGADSVPALLGTALLLLTAGGLLVADRRRRVVAVGAATTRGDGSGVSES
ncbi:hypothetical protein DNL40_13070 [Xylanimonas oleitrophica]|uniref:Bacterial spore germination immunoglobulin-like domain-containing protein n=1 Tax=Xylanimonas oleitrophica TaxID=2607479 RepID=A0A2W5WLR4_9MICO|nr:hypothetical protein DNL40_13070 [Xylanimonas oleitrophica]